MSVSILETLENALSNLDSVLGVKQRSLSIAIQQLDDSVILLQKGYSIDDDLTGLIDRYGCPADVPEYENEV